MKRAQLGNTGLEVSVVGFGASPLGNVFGHVPAETANLAVALAIDQGVNVFDVSPYYGATLAEERLGRALEGKRQSIFLATKCGRYGGADFDFSSKAVTERFESSLKRLRTDAVDILQVHDIEFGSIQQIVHETLPAIMRLREDGKVRFIGATSYWPGLLAEVARAFPLDCVLNYCHSNLFADDMEQALVPTASALGVGILNASPLHMGLLSSKAVPEWHPAPLAVKGAAIAVREQCSRFGVDPGMLAVNYSIENTSAASTFVGVSNSNDVRQAISALSARFPYELLEAVRSTILPVHNLVWPSGLPENQDHSFAVQEEANAH